MLKILQHTTYFLSARAWAAFCLADFICHAH